MVFSGKCPPLGTQIMHLTVLAGLYRSLAKFGRISAITLVTFCKGVGRESSDSTGPIFIPRRRGAARRRSRRRAGLPIDVAHPWNGVLDSNLGLLTNERRGRTDTP